MQSIRSLDFFARIDAGLDWLSASHRRAASALLVVALVSFLPGIASLPPTNRDESRFANPVRRMVETGEHLDHRHFEHPRYRKPIGIYWLQAATVRAAEKAGFENARGRIVFYRIPSIVAATAAVLLTYWAALAFLARRHAMLAAAALAASLLVGVNARLATSDAALLAAAIAAFGALARLYLQLRPPSAPRPPAHEWGLAALFWTAMAASILLKGLIVLAVFALAAFVLSLFDRSARWFARLKPIPGVLWMLLLALPWFIAVHARAGGTELAVARDLFTRLLPGAEGGSAPPGYYWLLFWVLFWPVSPLAVLATGFAWRHRHEAPVQLLVAWIVPGWLMFELIVVKTPHHVLPFGPAIAILIALALERATPIDRWTKALAALWPLLAILLPAAAVFSVFFLDGRFGKAFWPFAAIGIVFGAWAWWKLLTESAERGLVLALIAALANAIAVYTVLPRLQGIAVAPRLVAAAAKAPCRSPMLASAGFGELNLVFLGGENTVLVRGGAAAEFLRLGGCRVAFVERAEERAFADRAALIGLTTERIGEVHGFNYSNLRPVTFLVLMAKEGG